MRAVSRNVNGLRACVGKGFQEVFDRRRRISSACRRL